MKTLEKLSKKELIHLLNEQNEVHEIMSRRNLEIIQDMSEVEIDRNMYVRTCHELRASLKESTKEIEKLKHAIHIMTAPDQSETRPSYQNGEPGRARMAGQELI